MKISSTVYAILAVFLGAIMTYVTFEGPLSFLMSFDADNLAVLRTIGKSAIAGLIILGWVAYVFLVTKMLRSTHVKLATSAILAIGFVSFLVYVTIIFVDNVLFIVDTSYNISSIGGATTIIVVVMGWYGVVGLGVKALQADNESEQKQNKSE